MTMSDLPVFALQMAVMIAVGLLGGKLARRCGQPAVLGEMTAGILLGPTVFGALAADWFQALFVASTDATHWRMEAANLAMLYFLFFVGLEIRLGQLVSHGRQAVVIGVAGCVVPLLAGLAIVYLLPDLWGSQADSHRLVFGLFIGAALANTANPVLARILLDLQLLRTRLGTTILTATIVDDLIGWSMLALVLKQFSSPEGSNFVEQIAPLAGVVGFFVLTIVAGRLLILPLLLWTRRVIASPVSALVLLMALIPLTAQGAERLGLHGFLGPFLLGIALAPSQRELGGSYHVLGAFVASFCIPLYFVSMGLSANFAASFDLLLVLVVFAAACISKIAGVFAAARATGMQSRSALGMAFGMNARGAIGIILASLGREHGIIHEPVYVALVLMAVGTSLLAAPAMKHLLTQPVRLPDRG